MGSITITDNAFLEIKNLIQNMNTSSCYRSLDQYCCYGCDTKASCSENVKIKILDIMKEVESLENKGVVNKTRKRCNND